MHTRRCIFIVFQYMYIYSFILMQTCVLQSWDEELAPTQDAPPYCGVGFVQVRGRDWVPPPQVTEQVPYAPQEDHAPSTSIK